MKEIKAIVHANRVAAVIQKLRERQFFLAGSEGPCRNLNASDYNEPFAGARCTRAALFDSTGSGGDQRVEAGVAM